MDKIPIAQHKKILSCAVLFYILQSKDFFLKYCYEKNMLYNRLFFVIICLIAY